jgi:hypothetical protein
MKPGCSFHRLWFEKGQAPSQLIASHRVNGVVDRTRPICAYPQLAAYKGAGNIDDAANFNSPSKTFAESLWNLWMPAIGTFNWTYQTAAASLMHTRHRSERATLYK